ncbi:hypothetical protein ACH5RR_036778 [Cinchona calisaya]|uniref:Uncharacterized protein n=1 Tax=Cinchona calisaya TaxID=153742 RepID=A0ABD2Y7T4_9GENT
MEGRPSHYHVEHGRREDYISEISSPTTPYSWSLQLEKELPNSKAIDQASEFEELPSLSEVLTFRWNQASKKSISVGNKHQNQSPTNLGESLDPCFQRSKHYDVEKVKVVVATKRKNHGYPEALKHKFGAIYGQKKLA